MKTVLQILNTLEKLNFSINFIIRVYIFDRAESEFERVMNRIKKLTIDEEHILKKK